MAKKTNILERSNNRYPAVSYIIAYKEEDIYRRRNLLFQINKLLNLNFEKEIIVVEYDSTEKTKNIQGIKHLWIPTISDKFNKSLCYNFGFYNSKHDIVCFIDCDLILEDVAHEQSIELLKDFDVIDPYCFVSYLDNKNSINFMNNTKFNHYRLVESGVISGGCFFLNRDKYLRFDERFAGYGYEDDMYDNNIFKNEQLIGRLEGKFSFHMWHPIRKDMQNNNKNLYYSEKKYPKKIKYIKI